MWSAHLLRNYFGIIYWRNDTMIVNPVSPAKAGVQELLRLRRFLDSGLRRNDGYVLGAQHNPFVLLCYAMRD
ncbi:MAG: hypothetical protein BZY81_07735 [SAR202 cluster bacterium Io17-Chloro-G4]|nr:MAG: hypothetical protein BZY81_07735 [SAR202 cluster bacterium Io17-Chloro-G4]